MHFALVSSIYIKQKVALFKVLARNLLTNSNFRENHWHILNRTRSIWQLQPQNHSFHYMSLHNYLDQEF